MEHNPNLTAAYLMGVIDKQVKAQGRDTVRQNADADPQARWARIPAEDACDFCVMLGSRGFVYHSEDKALHRGGTMDTYHEMCNCQIAVCFDPFMESYYKNGVHVTRGYGEGELAVPGRDGSYELRDVDIDELFEQYKAMAKSFGTSAYKRYADMPRFMADPLAYLRESSTVAELVERADEVLEAYGEFFTAKQQAKYLPSARSAAQARMAELNENEKRAMQEARGGGSASALRAHQYVIVSPYNVPTASGVAEGFSFRVPKREYAVKREADVTRISRQRGADPDEWEFETAKILDSLGFKVKFNTRSLKTNDRRADVTLDGRRWEIKNPRGSGYLCIHNQIKSNLYGENRHFLNPQSEWVVISNIRSSLTLDEMEAQLTRVMTGESGFTQEELSYIKRVMLVDKGGTAVVFDFEKR